MIAIAFEPVPGLAAVNVAMGNYVLGSRDCGHTTQLDDGSSGLFTLSIPVPATAGLPAECRMTVVNAGTDRAKHLSGTPRGFPDFLLPGQAFVIEVNGAATGWNVISAPGRWLAPASTVFYVDSVNGSDSNDGLAPGAGAAWATPQHAVDVLKRSVDFGMTRDGPIYIQLADGTYGSSVSAGIWVNGPFTGVATSDPGINAKSCPLVFKGNAANPSAVVVGSTAGDAITGIGGTFFCVQDMALASAASSDIGAGGASVIRFGNVILDRSAGAKIRSGHGSAVENYTGTDIYLKGDSPSVFWGLVDGNVYISRAIIHLDEDFSVTQFALSQSGGGLLYVGATIEGPGRVTGAKFAIDSGGYIYTGTDDVTVLPGSSPGLFNGGFYDKRLRPDVQ